MEENSKSGLYIVAIVGIIAIVGLIVLIMGVGTKTIYTENGRVGTYEDASGQVRAVANNGTRNDTVGYAYARYSHNTSNGSVE